MFDHFKKIKMRSKFAFLPETKVSENANLPKGDPLETPEVKLKPINYKLINKLERCNIR